MQHLTENEVKKILRKKDKLLKYIQLKRLNIYKEMDSLNENVKEEILRSVSLPSARIKDMPGRSSEHKDLGNVMMASNAQLKKYDINLRHMLWQLSEREESIHRVWVCFTCLEEVQYSILYDLYVDHVPYKTVEQESKLSHRAFEKHRKDAIASIINLYESDYTVTNIAMFSGMGIKQNRNKKISQTTGSYHQMSFDEFMQLRGNSHGRKISDT